MAIPPSLTIAPARRATPARPAPVRDQINNLPFGLSPRLRIRALGISIDFAWLAWSAFFALGLLLSGCVGAITREVCATVLDADGVVELKERSADSFHPIDRHFVLCAGTNIRSSPGSSAEISCFPNALIHLSEKTTLTIESLTVRKDGNETDDEVENRSAHCHLVAGTVDFSHRGTEGVAEFIVATSHGKVIAKMNCVARIRTDERKVRVTCASGMLTIISGNGSSAQTVEAGFVAEWSSKAPIMITAAAESSSGQHDVTEAFDAGQRLEALRKARGVDWLRKTVK